MPAYSEFNYCTPSGLLQYARSMSSITNEALAAGFITDAERVIDAYVGPGPRFAPELTLTLVTGAASGATVLAGLDGLSPGERLNYYACGGTYVEILDPRGGSIDLVHQKRLVVASSGQTLTLASGFNAILASGVGLTFRQVSAFPRAWDIDPYGAPRLPEGLQAAVAAQVEFGVAFGSEGFGLSDPAVQVDEGDVTSRTYSSGYSEARVPRGLQGTAMFISPRARYLLTRLIHIAGYLRG